MRTARVTGYRLEALRLGRAVGCQRRCVDRWSAVNGPLRLAMVQLAARTGGMETGEQGGLKVRQMVFVAGRPRKRAGCVVKRGRRLGLRGRVGDPPARFLTRTARRDAVAVAKEFAVTLSGRAKELLAATRSLTNGGHLAVIGDAGMGKTALLDVAINDAGVRGLRVCGNPDEAFSLVRSLAAVAAEHSLAPKHAVDIFAALDEEPAAPPHLQPPVPPQILLATERILERLSRTPGVCLVIDDLHLSDRFSLRLLLQIQSQRKLSPPIAWAARPFEMRQTHDLDASSLLLPPVRGTVVHLGPLGEEAVAAELAAASATAPSRAHVRRAMELTGGVPLLVAALRRALEPSVELASTLAALDPAALADPLADLPADLRDPAVAVALVEPWATPELISATLNLGTSDARNLLVALRRHGVTVDAAAGSPSFASASARHAVLRQIDPDRDRPIRRRLLDALARLPMDETQRTVLMCRIAASAVDLDAVATKVVRAGSELAFRRGDFNEAARLAGAVAVRQVSPADPTREQLDSELLAGLAYYRNHDPHNAKSHLERTLTLADSARTSDTFFRATLARNRLRMTFEPHPHPQDEVFQLFDLVPSDDHGRRALVFEELSELDFGSAAFERGEERAIQCVQESRAAGDALVEALGWCAMGLNRLGALRLGPARDAFKAAGRLAGLASDPWLGERAAARLQFVEMISGSLDRARHSAADASRLAGIAGDWAELINTTSVLTATALLSGQLDEAAAGVQRAAELFRRSGYTWGAVQIAGQAQYLNCLRPQAAHAQPDIAASTGQMPWFVGVQAAAEAGDEIELGRWWPARVPRPRPVTLHTQGVAFALVAAVPLTTGAGRDAAAAWVDPLVDSAAGGAAYGLIWPTSALRTAGVAVAALGDTARAQDLFDRAAAAALRSGASLELGRTHLCAAVLYSPGSPAADNSKHERELDIASTLFAEAGAIGLLRRVDRQSVSRSGRRQRDRPVTLGTMALMMTDIVDSTGWNQRLGDVGWVHVQIAHDDTLRACLDSYRGTEFAHTGDGLAASFVDIHAALRCAEAAHQSIAANPSIPAGLQLRIGLTVGQPIRRGGDLAGQAVARTKRIMGAAAPGDTTIDTTMINALGGPTATYESIGPVTLKGFDAPTEIWRIRTAAARP